MKKLKVVTELLLIFTVSSVFADQVEKNEIGQARNAAAIVINTKTLQKLQKILPELPEVVDQDMAIILCPEKDTPQWGECLYEVGGTGPAGGLVFYTTDGGRHGIEASPTDQGQSEWGCYNTEFEGVTGTAIGSGAANTKIISESNCVGRYSYSGEIAARVSNNYELNGFDDWYLPSRDELYLMNKDLIAKDLGGFKGRSYWSSSNYTISSRPDEFAWIQSFGGDNYGVSRFGELSVRSIRSF